MTTKEMAIKNYTRGLWTDEMIKRLVVKGKITSADYEEITGILYPEESDVSDTEALAIITGGN